MTRSNHGRDSDRCESPFKVPIAKTLGPSRQSTHKADPSDQRTPTPSGTHELDPKFPSFQERRQPCAAQVSGDGGGDPKCKKSRRRRSAAARVALRITGGAREVTEQGAESKKASAAKETLGRADRAQIPKTPDAAERTPRGDSPKRVSTRRQQHESGGDGEFAENWISQRRAPTVNDGHNGGGDSTQRATIQLPPPSREARELTTPSSPVEGDHRCRDHGGEAVPSIKRRYRRRRPEITETSYQETENAIDRIGGAEEGTCGAGDPWARTSPACRLLPGVGLHCAWEECGRTRGLQEGILRSERPRRSHRLLGGSEVNLSSSGDKDQSRFLCLNLVLCDAISGAITTPKVQKSFDQENIRVYLFPRFDICCNVLPLAQKHLKVDRIVTIIPNYSKLRIFPNNSVDGEPLP
uniref:Uncharacterized protein n=1 Tax=Steinernema glaseri TaxID=37863 RepID=A0A1I7YWL4_9BILA